MARLNPICFPITNEILTAYDNDINAPLFDTTGLGLSGDYLVFWVAPEDYDGNAVRHPVIRGYGGNVVDVQGILYEIEIICRDGREAIAYILDELIAAAEASIDQYAPITLLDFHVLDDATARSAGYTTRQGRLNYEREKGTFRSDRLSDNLGSSFTLNFIQTDG